MSELKRCQQCGGPMPQTGELAGRCPHCMLVLGFESWDGRAEPSEFVSTGNGEQSTASLSHSGTIGRYRILGLIGEGGMGAVYEAEQDTPRRTVALKIIRPAIASPELLRRFGQESQALGRVQHPGIAQIYEAGTVDTGFGPQPYFAMEFVRGRSPREYAEAHNLTTRDRLQMVAKICDGVHHAHQRGLIHRDLKPGNILVDDTGQPKILDFGVARVTDSEARATHQTDVGQLVGTLAYMSPEQALADPLDIDIRTDVYALGVILYELLSGQLPYPISNKIHETIQTIREQDPMRLSAVNRSYRGDIETIVAKALEKDRTRRYASAAELAADIRRYLSDVPIVARRQSPGYQLQKFARRHKAVVGSVAAIFVVLLAAAVTSRLQALRASTAALRASTAERTALEELSRANMAEEMAREQRDLAAAAEAESDRQRDIALGAQQEATTQRNLASAERDRITWHFLARESLRLASHHSDDELAALLARQAFLLHSRTPNQPRNLVEEALQQAVHLAPWSVRLSGHEGPIRAVDFSPDGSRVASGSTDGSVRVWNLDNPGARPLIFTDPEAAVNAVAFSPDGNQLAAAVGRTVRVWDLFNPKAPPLVPKAPSEFLGGFPIVTSLAFSADGRRLAFTGTAGVWLWDLHRPAASAETLPGSRDNPFLLSLFISVAFSPDGVHVAASNVKGGVWIWDLRSRSETPVVLQSATAQLETVAFSSDGKRLASAGAALEQGVGGRVGAHGIVLLWDVTNLMTPPLLLPLVLPGQDSVIHSVAFSRDGKRLASASSDGGVRLWDLGQPGSEPQLLPGHEGSAQSVAFSRDGRRLASAGDDYGVRVWNLEDLSLPLRPLKVHDASVESLAFSPDSAFLASGSADRTARLWDLRNSTAAPIELQHEDTVRSLIFSLDGARLASSTAGSARVWNMLDLDSPPELLTDRDGVESIAFLSGGMALIFSTLSNRFGLSEPLPAIKRWEFGSGLSHTLLRSELMGGSMVAFSSDGNRFASAPGPLGFICLFDLRRPDLPPSRVEGHKSGISALSFSNRGTLLASTGGDLALRVWDLENLKAPPVVFRGARTFAGFSLDDTRVFSQFGGDVGVWDLREPSAPPVIFKAGAASIRSVAVSRDGTHLAIGDSEGNIWLSSLWSSAADYLCTRVSRNLSIAEWRLHVGNAIPYERTCPSLPAGIGVP